MEGVSIKSIFSEAWRQYKSNWLILTVMAFVGYLLPLALFFVVSYSLFSEDMNDCAPCALAALMVTTLCLITFEGASIATKALIRAHCYKKYDDKTSCSVVEIMIWSLRWAPFEFLITQLWTFTIIILIQMSDFIILIIGAFCIVGLPVCLISLLFMFAPYILCNPQAKFWRNIRFSMKLFRDNAGIVVGTSLIRNIISLLLFCTGIGIVVAIPFSIIVNTVLYRKIGFDNNHSSSFL